MNVHVKRVRADQDNTAPSSPILACLADMHEKYRGNFDGELASYIPELAKADPSHFGIALVTADGHTYQVGNSRQQFTIQSISKPFVYGLALEDHGPAHVITKVGVEPTGEAFNAIVFDERGNRPFNPMVNAGAIATTALIKGHGHAERLARILGMFASYAGRRLEIDEAVFRSERLTGHRNRAIAHLELNFGMIDERLEEHLDLYFEQCSILVSAHDLAMMAATLANNGVNPRSGERALAPHLVRKVLSIMSSCGMYDFSGEWGYRIGLPAKSGVGGGIIAVLPGQFGIGIFSPLLDERGNSCRGIQVCEDLSERFNLHVFDAHTHTASILRRRYRGATVRSKRLRTDLQRSLLDRRGSELFIYELQGDLFFSTIEQVFRALTEDLADLSFLILDCKRVVRIDRCARRLLSEMEQLLAENGKALIVASLAGPLRGMLLENEGAERLSPQSYFSDIDGALEWCEDYLIASETDGGDAPTEPLLFAAMDVLRGFGDADTALLASIASESRFRAGEAIVREGDAADRLYLLAAGMASVQLTVGADGRAKRLGTIAPGVAFGELALFNGGTRTADVVAETDVTCYELKVEALDCLAREHPQIQTKLLRFIGRQLSDRLRRATAEIRALEQ
jgi:glutaminase